MSEHNVGRARRSPGLPALLLGSALLLAACGGGGVENGGGGQNPPPPPPPPPANSAPTIGGEPATSTHAGSEYAFTPDAGDPDGDELSFTVENAPHWASFDEATGTLSGIPLTADLGDYNDITITVSDGEASAELPAFSVTVLAQVLGMENFSTEGDVFPTETGYRSVGDLVLNTGERILRFEEADLTLGFDDDGRLVDFEGETIIPTNPVDTVTIDSPVRVIVGLMSGAEINADEAFGIALQEDTYYFVFFASVALDITIENRATPGVFESITLETPAAGQVILITDPTDPFLYRFGSQPLIGTLGRGESTNGLIPFVPTLEHPELDTFSGHELDKGAMGLGIKIFDFFELEGTRVVKNPSFTEIDWEEPFQSSVEYRAGLNGDASFAFGVLGVGLFSFDLADASATLDVGFDRQSMAMQARIAPDISWVPDWFPFVPATEAVGDWFVNGDGEFAATLSGSYVSAVPAAEIAGSMAITNDGTTLSGTTGDETGEFTVSVEFAGDVTTARLGFEEDFAAGIRGTVTEALDRELAEAQQALADLEAATADYEFELSLRGLRPLLAGIADTAIGILNQVPGQIRNEVDAATVAYIRNQPCVLFVCLEDLVDENAIGDQAGAAARNQAAARIVPYVAAMENLKTQAAAGDSEALRQSLQAALLAAHDHQVFSERITVTVAFPDPFPDATVYNQVVTRRIIPADTAADILTAANNVHRIGETSEIMISAQAVYDAFPTEEVFATVRQEVQDGVAEIPTLDGMGAVIVNDGVDAFITVGGVDHPVAANVFKPSEAIPALGDLIADGLLYGD